MDITERSRKFYDGTYKFVVDGYTDEAKGKCITSRNGELR
jgi:hypothetical protein